MACIFCRIVSGEVNVDIVEETNNFIAFRDVNPVAPTHVLVVPKQHIDSPISLQALGGEALQEMFQLIDKIAKKENIKKSGYRLILNNGKDAGQEINHLHFHVIGGRKMGRLG
jgi:histidine triad (HIT) family protein